MEKIVEYLAQEERDYDEGLLLLSKYGKNRILANRLSRKPWVEKLEYELNKLVHRANLLVKAQKKAAKNHKEDLKETVYVKSLPKLDTVRRNFVVKNKQKVSYNDLPQKLKTAWDDNANLYKHARSLHEKLKLMFKASEANRQKVLDKLFYIQTKIRFNWEKIDEFDPIAEANTEGDETDPIKIDSKRISANRAYISRNAKKVKPGEKNDLFDNIQIRITELVTSSEGFKDSQSKFLVNLGFLLKNPSE